MFRSWSWSGIGIGLGLGCALGLGQVVLGDWVQDKPLGNQLNVKCSITVLFLFITLLTLKHNY